MTVALKLIPTVFDAALQRLTKQEREERVLDLYYNQKKTYRDIAKLERICPRDIGAIVSRESRDIESQQTMSKGSRAYMMFSEGKSPTDVAIALDLREPEVTKLFAESWRLGKIYDLNHIYEETKGNIAPLVKLHRLIKAEGLKVEDAIRIIEINNNDLPSVEHKYENLRVEIDWLEKEIQASVRILESYSSQIIALGQRFADNCLACQEEGDRLADLQQEKIKVEAFVKHIEHDPDYIKIRKVVEEQVYNMLSNSKDLLKYAVFSVTESIRNDPTKYRPLVCWSSPSTMSYSNTRYSGSYMNGQELRHLSIEDYRGMLAEEADKLYNMIVKDRTDQIIDDCSSSAMTSMSSISPVSSSDENYVNIY